MTVTLFLWIGDEVKNDAKLTEGMSSCKEPVQEDLGSVESNILFPTKKRIKCSLS